MKRISRVTTKAGDKGKTTLGDGSAISKFDTRIVCIGEVDELNAHLGQVKVLAPSYTEILENIQQRLFDIGGELCLPDQAFFKIEHLETLEASCAELNAQLPPLTDFVLPGGNQAAAAAHIARTVCRRAERSLWQLASEQTLGSDCIRYLNRLSDWLFILARVLSRQDNEHEPQWEK